MSSGITYREVREALRRLGLADDAGRCEAAGIRLLKMQMPMPFNPVTMRHFARGLRELLVIEEKHPNIESLVKDALYNQASDPLVTGKLDEREGPLMFPGHGALDSADDHAARASPAAGAARARRAAPRPSRPGRARRRRSRSRCERTPFYCSGCPHNRSTQVPERIARGGRASAVTR